MTDKFDWLVIGGGFRSMIAAYALAKQGQSVVLVEPAKAIGGFMTPIKWGDFWLDKGPQFFDNFEEQDKGFMDDMLGDDVLQEIGFSYASYFNGKRTDDFAIPDWRTLGDEVTASAFNDLLAREIHQTPPEAFGNLSEMLSWDSGATLSDHTHAMTQKMLGRDAEDISPQAALLTTYIGRKLLFDQDAAVDLKKSSLIDNFLAARKVTTGEVRYNLYPKGKSLEVVRLAMVAALDRAGVTTLTETSITDLDAESKTATLSNGAVNFGKVLMGVEIREAESVLTGGTSILEKTHVLPEIFHCFVVPTDQVVEPYYVVDYDPDHVSSRYTQFCNYMQNDDQTGHGIICIEEPIVKDSAEWNDPTLNQDKSFREAMDVGVVSCDSYREAKSFKIPSTFKIPLVGIEGEVDRLLDHAQDRFGDAMVIPDPYGLTRKETLDDLRALGILQ